MTVTTTTPREPMNKMLRSMNRRISGTRTRRMGRPGRADGWRVWLINTVTGDKGAQLDPRELNWSVLLNDTEEMALTVRKDDLRGITRSWYTPWLGGVLLTYTRAGVEIPWIAGPIINWGAETREELPLVVRGYREIWAHLVIGTDLRPRDTSLGNIMWLLAAQAQIKPGGGPPIYDGSPDPTGRGHERNYEAWNLANTNLDKLMTELSEVINGPDVMFRPQWRDADKTGIRVAVCHGTALSPRITPTANPVFDTTPARSPVKALSVATDAKALVSRVWATGAGEGTGTARVRVEDLTLVQAGFPFLETVVSQPDQTDTAKLREQAAGELAARVDAIDQITVTARADHQTTGVGAWRVGDPAKVRVAGWEAIPDGVLDTRIIKASGSLSNDFTVDFQTDSWV